MIFQRISTIANSGLNQTTAADLVRPIRLCNQSALVLALSLLPALALYALTSAPVHMILGGSIFVAEILVILLNRWRFHLVARITFFIANDFLVYICSNVLGKEAYFFLFYIAGLIAPFALFRRDEVWPLRLAVGFAAVCVLVDVLLNYHPLIYLSPNVADQVLARWLVVPSAFVACCAFLILLLRENERSERELLSSNNNLETIVTSMNDIVFEVNDRLQVLNIWTSDDSKLPQPREKYACPTLEGILPPDLVRCFASHIYIAINSGQRQSFDYQSPANQQWYEVKISRLPVDRLLEQRVSIVLHNITEERATRQRLLIHDQIIQDNHDAVLFLDRTGLIQSCNRGATRLYGYSEAELRGQSIFLFRTGRGAHFPNILRSLSDQGGWSGETRHRRRDGTEFDSLLTVSNTHGENGEDTGYAVISRDISALKETQEQLRISERRFKSIAENAPGIVYEWYTYLDGTRWGFNYISPQVRNILGVEPEAVMQDVNLLIGRIHPEDMPHFRDSILQATRQRSRWEAQARLIMKDGVELWMRGSSVPIDWDSEKVVFHGILMDITPERRFHQDLMAAKERAEEASRAKAEFLSIMSHEIRTPMNAIIGLAHLLLEENPQPDQIDNLHTLRFSAENLLALINDILDFSKIEAGKISLEQVEFDLHHLLDAVSRAASYSANEKGFQVREKVDARVPKRVVGDPTRLAQILNNLLSNAVKFTHQGLVELSVKPVSPIAGQEVALEFRVTDTGIGIAEDKVERIFDYFTQADESITRSYGGTGLGLAITKALVEIFGSQIQVHSEVGAGSTFFFTLHLALPSDQRREELRLPGQDAVNLSGRRILLVEDNPINVMVAAKLLRKWGALVDIAEDGYDAVEQVLQHDYDLVLMDIQMPMKDGYAATRDIRALEGDQYRRLPIIALSAATTEDVQAEALRAGMNGFLTKPINPTELKGRIQRYLRPRPATTLS